MSDVIVVAVIAAAGPVAVAIFARWQDAKSQDRAIHADALRADSAHRREIELRHHEHIVAIRARQTEAIRTWVRDHLMAGVDTVHYAIAAKLAPSDQLRHDLTAAVARLAAGRTTLESQSLNPAVAEISDVRAIQAFRDLAAAPDRLLPPFQALVDYVANHRSESWSAEETAEFDVMSAAADAADNDFYRDLANLNRLLEDYSAPTDVANPPTS